MRYLVIIVLLAVALLFAQPAMKTQVADAGGDTSSILGGKGNVISGQFSLAFGKGVNVGNDYVAAFYDSLTPGKLAVNYPNPNSALHCNGSMATSVETIDIPDTYLLEDAKYHTIFTEGDGITLTLPPATTYKGRRYYIRNTDELETVTLDVIASGGNIERDLSITLYEDEGIVVQSDGTDWWKISDF